MIKISEETNLPHCERDPRSTGVRHHVEVKPNGNPKYHDIRTFPKDGSYPELANSTDKRKLRKIACRFFLNDKTVL